MTRQQEARGSDTGPAGRAAKQGLANQITQGQRTGKPTYIPKISYVHYCLWPASGPMYFLLFPTRRNLLNVGGTSYINQVSLSWDTTRASSMFGNLWLSYYHYTCECLKDVLITELSLKSQTEFQMDDRWDVSRDWHSRKTNRLNQYRVWVSRVILLFVFTF